MFWKGRLRVALLVFLGRPVSLEPGASSRRLMEMTTAFAHGGVVPFL
jgi:hypothetical protein